MIEKKGTALYTQVKRKLLDSIQSGVYKTGDKLPTELKLCELYQVSRTTIRLALQQLDLEGRIQKKQGKGTFVTKNKIPHRTLAPIMSFPEHMQNLGRRSESKVLEAAVIPADSPLDQLLRIDAKDPVTKLVRLRLADDEPVAYEISHIPWHFAPRLASDDCTGSLFKLLKEQYHLKIFKAVETLEPVIPDRSVAELLKIDAGQPVFLIKTVTFLEDETPVEYNLGYHRGDMANFIIERYFSSEK